MWLAAQAGQAPLLGDESALPRCCGLPRDAFLSFLAKGMRTFNYGASAARLPPFFSRAHSLARLRLPRARAALAALAGAIAPVFFSYVLGGGMTEGCIGLLLTAIMLGVRALRPRPCACIALACVSARAFLTRVSHHVPRSLGVRHPPQATSSSPSCSRRAPTRLAAAPRSSSARHSKWWRPSRL